MQSFLAVGIRKPLREGVRLHPAGLPESMRHLKDIPGHNTLICNRPDGYGIPEIHILDEKMLHYI